MTTPPDRPSTPPQAPPDPDTIQPEEPLPGVRLYPPAEFVHHMPSPDRVPLEDAPFHTRYEALRGACGFQNTERPGFSGHVSGKDLRRWLAGSSSFWGLSEVRMTGDQVIRFRKTPRHAVQLFNPDRTSPVVINQPVRQITGEAYRVTTPEQGVQVWRGQTVRSAVATCLRPGPSDWPDGWAELTATEAVRFEPSGFPWSEAYVWTADPIDPPATWGRPCTQCGLYAPEHDPNHCWSRCAGWTIQAPPAP
ncbi:hypothetical protein [Streptomyces sp. NBC_01708]|uniref:hypothetical protein n=1 Tax=Streptomyces sp. NBC_01708 TaxID=2975915 RepID=UPI002E2FE1A9|nr:hypothetical protein [Streptomyces sp. NBC_01708]